MVDLQLLKRLDLLQVDLLLLDLLIVDLLQLDLLQVDLLLVLLDLLQVDLLQLRVEARCSQFPGWWIFSCCSLEALKHGLEVERSQNCLRTKSFTAHVAAL